MLVVHVMVGRGKASAQVGAAEGAVARRRLGRADRVGGGNAQRRHEQQQQRSASHSAPLATAGGERAMVVHPLGLGLGRENVVTKKTVTRMLFRRTVFLLLRLQVFFFVWTWLTSPATAALKLNLFLSMPSH